MTDTRPSPLTDLIARLEKATGPEGADCHLHIYKKGLTGAFVGEDQKYPGGHHGQAGIPAIALCITAFKAMSQQ